MNKIAVAKELVAVAEEIEAAEKTAVKPSIPDAKIKRRLEYLRKEIEAERISYGEIAELRSLVKYIDPDDVQLLEWADVEEKIR